MAWATDSRSYTASAVSLPMAASAGSSAARRAPSPLLDTGISSTSGRLRCSHSVHCASACGCATTCRISAICPVRDISTCRTGTVISAVIRSGVFRNRSWVRVTDPSVEFSMGTTPKSTVPASVTRNTSSMDAQGTPSTASPKRARMACSLNVPQGPRKATRSGRSSPRQADISSRQSERIAVSGNGPGLAACSLRMMAASRSGR